MRLSVPARLAGLLLAAALAACQATPAAPTETATSLPSATASATASPSATPTLTPTTTPTPTLTPTATTTATPTATSTQTATPDPYAAAVLTLADMPPDFSPISVADRVRLKFSDDDLAKSFAKAFVNNRPHNVSAFVYSDGKDVDLFLSSLYYPLDKLEQAAQDLALSDSSLFQKAFVNLGGAAVGDIGATVTAKTLPGVSKLGTHSTGVIVTFTSSAGAKTYLDVVAVRRGDVFEFYEAVYTNKAKTPANIAALAKILDDRVAGAQP